MNNEREVLDHLESIESGLWGTAYDKAYEGILPRLTGNINLIKKLERDIKISFSLMAGKNSPLKYLIKTDEVLIEWLNKLVDNYQNYNNLVTLVFCFTYKLEPGEVEEFLRVTMSFNTYHDESRWLKIHGYLENGDISALYETTEFLRHLYGLNISYEQVRANNIHILKMIVNSDIPLDFTRASQGTFTNNDIIAMGFNHKFLREHYRPVIDGMTVKEANKFFTEYGEVVFCTRRLMKDVYRYRVIDFLIKEIVEGIEIV